MGPTKDGKAGRDKVMDKLMVDAATTRLGEHCAWVEDPCNGAVLTAKVRAFRALVGTDPEIYVDGDAWVNGKARALGYQLRLGGDKVRKWTRKAFVVWDRHRNKEARILFRDVKYMRFKLAHPEAHRKSKRPA